MQALSLIGTQAGRWSKWRISVSWDYIFLILLHEDLIIKSLDFSPVTNKQEKGKYWRDL